MAGGGGCSTCYRDHWMSFLFELCSSYLWVISKSKGGCTGDGKECVFMETQKAHLSTRSLSCRSRLWRQASLDQSVLGANSPLVGPTSSGQGCRFRTHLVYIDVDSLLFDKSRQAVSMTVHAICRNVYTHTYVCIDRCVCVIMCIYIHTYIQEAGYISQEDRALHGIGLRLGFAAWAS